MPDARKIDTVFAALAAVACCAGLSLAWLPQPMLWYGFSGLILAMLAAWCLCRLVLPGSFPIDTSSASPSFLWACLVAIPVWGLIQLRAGWTAYRFGTEVDILRWAVFAAIFFLCMRLPPSEGAERKFRSGFALYAFLLTVFSLLDLILGIDPSGQGERSAGPFPNPDHFASFIALAFPVVLCEAFRPGKLRILWIGATATLLAAAVASGSRAGITVIVLEAIVVPLLTLRSGEQRERGRALPTIGAVAGLTTVLALGVGLDTITSRFLRLGADFPTRYQLSRASVDMFLRNPWKGYGLGSWPHVYPAHALIDLGLYANAAHNDWAQWACDGGLLMIAAMLVLFGASVRVTWRNPWAVGIPAVLLHCLADFPMQGRFLPSVFWMVYAVAARRSSDRAALKRP